MTLLGKIFTVLIFIMSIVFMSLAMATFATHREWRTIAESNKKKISELTGLNDLLKTEIENHKSELAAEQVARRAAISTLHGKVAYAQEELKKATKQFEEDIKEYQVKRDRAVDLANSLKVASDRIAVLDEKLRGEQTERETQYLLAVKYNELLNQALSALDNLKERRSALEEQLARVTAKATAAGVDVNALVDAPRPPAIDAQVLRVNARNTLVEISIGADDGLKKGHTMHVSRGNTYLGVINIKDIEFDRSVGEVDKKMQRGLIREGDHVTTKLN